MGRGGLLTERLGAFAPGPTADDRRSRAIAESHRSPGSRSQDEVKEAAAPSLHESSRHGHLEPTSPIFRVLERGFPRGIGGAGMPPGNLLRCEAEGALGTLIPIRPLRFTGVRLLNENYQNLPTPVLY